jgi:hypothetical protein
VPEAGPEANFIVTWEITSFDMVMIAVILANKDTIKNEQCSTHDTIKTKILLL